MLKLTTDDLRMAAKLMDSLDFEAEQKKYNLDDAYINDLRSALIEMGWKLDKTGEFEIETQDSAPCDCPHCS